MKKIFFKTAYTLIELIISLVLASVVILGIFSINMVLNGNHQDYGQRYLVRSETQATLNHILNNATLAVGSGYPDSFGNADLGILSGAGNPPGVGDANTFCIHQAANANISGSASALWLCYTWYPSGGTYPYQIMYCTFSYTAATANPSFRGALPCSTISSPLTGPTFLGTAYSNPAPAFSTTTDNFSITIQNCLTNSAATCNASGVGISSDPVNNPEVQVSGSIFPPQEGTG